MQKFDRVVVLVTVSPSITTVEDIVSSLLVSPVAGST